MAAFRSINPYGIGVGGVQGAANDTVGTMDSMAKARILQGQMQYQRRLAELHGNLFQSQANLDDARRLEIGQKMVQNRSITDLASIVGKSQQIKKSLQTAAFGNDPATTISAYQLLQQRGVPFTPSTPENPQFTSRGDLMDMLSGVATGATSEIAAQQPGGAASMLTPRNVPANAASYNSLGDLIGMGPQTPIKPTVVPANASVRNPDGSFTQAPSAPQKTPPLHNVGPHQVALDGQNNPVFTNTLSADVNLGTAIPSLLSNKSPLSENTQTNLAEVVAQAAIKRFSTVASQGTQDKVAPTNQVYSPKTSQDYDAIPTGATYIHPDGTKRVKK